jgi:hypothetical protein
MASTTHSSSEADRQFRAEFEACLYAPEAFNHRAHVRLAYTFLVEHDVETAVAAMRSALVAFLEHNGIEATKYHETLTRAWVLAVRHFMEKSGPTASADDLIARNPMLLDTKIMLTHYSAGMLFSDRARATFVEPDLEEIPGYET